MKTFGQRLKASRKEAGLSQREVSQKVGLSQSLLSELENDLYPTSGFTVQLANLYKVSALWLANGVGLKSLSDNDEILNLGRLYLDADEEIKRIVLLALGSPESDKWRTKSAQASLEALKQVILDQKMKT